MKAPVRNYSMPSIGLAITLLTSCGGSQLPVGAPGAMPQSRAIATHVARSGSWMLPAAQSEDLLYISTLDGHGSASDVYVYSFPKTELVGTLYGITGGMCSDDKGDVWITRDYSWHDGTIVEYLHGRTRPIRTLHLNVRNVAAVECAIDPTSGNLAVLGEPEFAAASTVAIFDRARGTPHVYKMRFMATPHFCSYDGEGNLFMDGSPQFNSRQPYAPVFAELRRGEGKVKEVSFASGGFPASYPSGIQWDGKYLTVGADRGLNRYLISEDTATYEGATVLKHVVNVGDFWIQGSKVVVLENWPSERPSVQIDRYPAGGLPVRILDTRRIAGEPFRATVSVVPNR
jgi:hypothetical protein